MRPRLRSVTAKPRPCGEEEKERGEQTEHNEDYR